MPQLFICDLTERRGGILLTKGLKVVRRVLGLARLFLREIVRTVAIICSFGLGLLVVVSRCYCVRLKGSKQVAPQSRRTLVDPRLSYFITAVVAAVREKAGTHSAHASMTQRQ